MGSVQGREGTAWRSAVSEVPTPAVPLRTNDDGLAAPLPRLIQ